MDKTMLICELSNLLEVIPSKLNSANVELYSFDNWDSLSMVSMIGVIDNLYKVIIAQEELMECKTLKDIFNLIERKEAIDSVEIENNVS